MSIKRIIFEGIDKSGKSTLSRIIFKILKNLYRDKRILYVAEPTNDKDELISISRNIIKNRIKYDNEITEETRNELFLIEREILYSKILNLRNENLDYIIVSDRSFISNVCIQPAFGIDTFENLLEKNRKLISDYNIPTDIIFYLNRKDAVCDLENSNDDVLKNNLLEHRCEIKSNYDFIMTYLNESDVGVFEDTKVIKLNVVDDQLVTTLAILSKLTL